MSRADDLAFVDSVIKRYREVRKIHYYEYSPEDRAALQACASDLRPFTFSVLPATALFWGLGKLVPNPGRLGLATRTALVVGRLVAAGEVFRYGYLAGLRKQAMDCGERLASLRTALGGEIVALMREQDPRHPLLRFERPPAELAEDGSRPRIAGEAARLAQVEHLKRELAAAKQGLQVDRADERADERLLHWVRHREEMLREVQEGGGAPRQPRGHAAEYESATGGGPAASGWPQQRQQGVAAASGDDPFGEAGSVDPLVLLLGGGDDTGWAEPGGEDAAGLAEEEARQRRRRERRSRWWRRHGGRVEDGGAH